MNDKLNNQVDNHEGEKMSILTILTLIFMVLKLSNHIDWSWWWVLSPSLLWISLFLTFAIFEISKTPEQRMKDAIKKKYGF